MHTDSYTFSMDYGEIEAKLVGLSSKDASGDIYRELAAEMFNVAYEDVTVGQRKVAKTVALRLVYSNIPFKI